MRQQTVLVVANSVKEGRCRFCRDRILWAIRASTPGHPAKSMPFNPPRPFVISAEQNDETGLVFERWPLEQSHFNTCRRRPKAAKRPKTAPPAPVPERLRKRAPSLFDEVDAR